MKFWHSPQKTRSPDTDQERFVLRPLLPILIFGQQDAGLYTALVDTGSDSTFIPRSVADDLQIPIQPCTGPPPAAFGGGRIDTFFADVELQLSDGEDDCRWTARALFFDANETVILGHLGFLSHFTATFDGEAGTLDLTPNATLPNGKSP